MDKFQVVLNDRTRQRAAQALANVPDGWVLRLEPMTRSIAQNATIHGIFSDVAKQAKWVGRVLVPHQWKTLFISGHAAASGQGMDMVPGMEGEFCNIRESSAKMSVGRMSSLIDYSNAWCANNNVRLRAYGYEGCL
ncbi:recombination protein NinB [Cupriavidus basilensis]|uniref:recombination protein NinB n=1 Tax=Cupriavidus basilensis TaxID=68895 RepID=UPI0039F6DF29